MGKTLFAHDHKFKLIKGEYFSTGGLSMSVLERYIKKFGDLEILARVVECDEDSSKFHKIDSNLVKVTNYKGLSLNEISNKIEKSDYVIIRLPSIIGQKIGRICINKKKKYFTEVVGCPWDALWNHSWKGKLVAPLMSIATKQITKKSTYTLYVTNEFLQKRYPTNGKSVGCSDVIVKELDENILEKREEKNSIKDVLTIKIATVGAVNVKYKGQEYVIEAINILKKIGYNCTYYIIGGGDDTYLKSVANKFKLTENVIFTGNLQTQKVFEILDSVDIYIQPSLQEGLPRSVVEAMSRGCPIIGTNVGGIPELCDSSFVVKRKSSDDIADKIVEILTKLDCEAKRSFELAKEYRSDVLENRRNNFFDEFKNSNIL